jgi:oxepin-CoA hydrolase/3-oxo-5,6-dehydrosuberyl-CoA semialdehyde dehydrogenase
MDTSKKDFIQYTVMKRLNKLPSAALGKWGKMNGQQMVEHLSLIFCASSGKITVALATPEEQLPKYKAFLWSDKEFRENTKAPSSLIPEEPQQLKHATMPLALQELQDELDYFFRYFEINHGIKTMHPAFGELDYEEWIQAHYKHVMHHLKQFELL